MVRQPALRDELLRLVDLEPDEAVDERLSVIFADGWPGLREVGPMATDAAWRLAFRADRLNAERRAWLPALRQAVVAGDADPRHYATLVDRVAVVDGEPQTYGTVAHVAADGEVELEIPSVDPAHLDERREELGLPPLAAEAAFLADGPLVPDRAERGAVPINQWPMLLEGHVSVEAALEAGVRKVHRVWAMRPGDRRLGRLRALCRDRDVLIDQVEPELIDELSAGRSHGGVVAAVGPRQTSSIGQLLDEVGESPLLVMLDGIEDPFNYAQALRALYAAGVDGLVVRRHWETAVATVTRASAGTSELMPTATVASAEEAADACRAAGLRVACAVARGETPLEGANLRGGLFLLIGGERRGVTRSFVERADVRLRIDYGRERAPELGAAAAAAIIGFEALRQRRSGPA